MSVEVAGVRKAVEISWETGNAPVEPPLVEPPPGFPTHPIYLPPYVDNTLPGQQPGIDNTLPEPEQPVDPGYGVDEGAHPDHELPGDQPRPDHELPGDQPEIDNTLPQPEQPVDPGYGVDEGARPSHPIYLPPYIDNSLPGPQPHPDHELPEPPPDLIEGIPPEKWEAIVEFLTGNLPPYQGPPQVTPMHGTVAAVQVFAQGQDGDWSNTAVMPNDGKAVLTYPEGFSGESYVEVRDLTGALIDSGTIQVEA